MKRKYKKREPEQEDEASPEVVTLDMPDFIERVRNFPKKPFPAPHTFDELPPWWSRPIC